MPEAVPRPPVQRIVLSGARQSSPDIPLQLSALLLHPIPQKESTELCNRQATAAGTALGEKQVHRVHRVAHYVPEFAHYFWTNCER